MEDHQYVTHEDLLQIAKKNRSAGIHTSPSWVSAARLRTSGSSGPSSSSLPNVAASSATATPILATFRP